MQLNMYKFEILQGMAKKYNQVNDDSLLWKDIMLVLDCTEKQAKKYALSHCNSVSFWMGLFITDKICINYDEYFKIGFESGYIKENGYITDKPALCGKLGVKNFKLNFIEDYNEIKGLSNEAVQKLNQIKPDSLGQASRISGVSPADINVILIYLESRKRKNNE